MMNWFHRCSGCENSIRNCICRERCGECHYKSCRCSVKSINPNYYQSITVKEKGSGGNKDV